MAKRVAKKKRGSCVRAKMAKGMGKKKARRACGVKVTKKKRR